MLTFSLFDLRFLLSRVHTSWLLEEIGGLAPLGPTGIRQVQGTGNASLNTLSAAYWFGAGDTLFPRLTFNRLLATTKKNDVISSPFANAIRGAAEKVIIGNTVRVDANGNVTTSTAVGTRIADSLNPRTISNYIADSSNPVGFQSLNPADPNYAIKLQLKLQDNPAGRISPVSGAINPLAYSNWTSQFGQFFDHGLDFVAKGVDGKFDVQLLPSDGLYSAGRATTISGSRSNTVNVTFGSGSSDSLLSKMGLNPLTYEDKPTWAAVSTITTPGTPASGAFAYEGNLVLNDTLINVGARDVEDLVNQLNFYAPTTGVTVTAQAFPEIPGVVPAGSYQLTLTPARGESFNQTSPFIDLSQNYGSDNSRTLFLREYLSEPEWRTALGNPALEATLIDLTTGSLLNAGATVNGETKSGMANWGQVKSNALKLGITLHDRDIQAIPLVALNESGQPILDVNGMPQLVALNRTTGEVVYVKNTDLATDATIQALIAGSLGALTPASFVLMTTRHAFLNDMAPFTLASSTVPPGVVVTNGVTNIPNPAVAGTFFLQSDFLITATGDNPANYTAAMRAYFSIAPGAPTFQPLDSHFVSGDGRLNENIGLTAVHEVFLTEHNRVLTMLKTQYGFTGANATQPAGGWTWIDPLTNEESTITGEDLFQAAKLVVEMEYQHMVFDQFVRKLSPNIGAFAGVNPLIDARVSSEFANAVYRLGHSMLPDAVGMRDTIDATQLSTTTGSAVVRVVLANHGLATGNQVDLSGVNTAIGGIAATRLNGRFTITRVDNNTFSFTAAGTGNATATISGLAADKVQLDINKQLIDAFLSPTSYVPGTTSGLLAEGSSAQVGMRIDEKVTDALRDNLLGKPLDLATLNLVRGRDAGIPTLNEMRGSIQPIAPLALQPTLTPYTSWTTFRNNLKGALADQNATLKNFIMAYAADDILTKFALNARNAAGATATTAYGGLDTLDEWYALRASALVADQTAYMNGLKAAAEAAFANATWMGVSGNKDFNRIDAWIGGLAEKEVPGGMLGSTFDAVFAMQMMNLQNGDNFYYLQRIIGTEFFNEFVEGNMLADMVMRSTGATHLYSDIFSVADKSVEMADVSQIRVNTLNALTSSTTNQQAFDLSGNVITAAVGRAGYVGTTLANQIFYGNPGNYLDARNVLNPNGVGNASEVIGGTANADRISSLGGNDAVYGDGGNDTVDGGSGVDFLHGGDGDDSLQGGTEDDFIYGDGGNDILRGGIGIDAMFGNDGNDSMFGGLGADAMVGGPGNDLMYGGDGTVVNGILDPEPAGTLAALDDGMFGGQGDDTMYGGGGWDSLDGETGHDLLIPGAGGATLGGRELMNGGQGDDLFIIESAVDFANHDIADNGLSYAQLVNKGPSFRVGNGLGIDEVRFTQTVAADIVIAGTNGLGVASIFLGVERVVIGTGFGATADTSGLAAINIDAALANPGIFEGLEMIGNAGPNTLIGTDFNDRIDGGLGDDLMEGGLGDDTYVLSAATDGITELTGGGVDTVVVNGPFNYSLDALDPLLFGSFENLTLQSTALQGTGNDLDNVIIGNASNNTLFGLGGNDLINGGDGNDTVIGGGGADNLFGGVGLDTFLYNADITEIGNDPNLLETIFDFNENQDILNLSAIDANITLANNQAFSFIGSAAFTAAGQLRFEPTGTGDGILYGNVDGTLTPDFQIRLAGVTTFSGIGLTPTLAITSLNGAGINEGNTGTSTHAFQVSLSRPIASPVVVSWGVSGTGTSPANATDFGGTLPSGQLTIPAGSTSGTINVLVSGDTTQEVNETFTVTISTATAGIALGTDAATSTILTDDGGSLIGTTGNDALVGTALNDTFRPGDGRDTMTGAGGTDTFVFVALTDSRVGGNRDTITDFIGGTGAGFDIIDLSAIDANPGVAGDQAFTFIGTNAFTGVGQVRYSNGVIQLNTDPTLTTAEMEIGLTTAVPASLVTSNFIL